MCIERRLGENDEVSEIREALGAIAVGKPAVYWLFVAEDGAWLIRREGDLDDQVFETRDQALAAIQLVVARCSSYRLYLQGADGRIARSSHNWPSRGSIPGR